jgi:hypothetical protein
LTSFTHAWRTGMLSPWPPLFGPVLSISAASLIGVPLGDFAGLVEAEGAVDSALLDESSLPHAVVASNATSAARTPMTVFTMLNFSSAPQTRRPTVRRS